MSGISNLFKRKDDEPDDEELAELELGATNALRNIRELVWRQRVRQDAAKEGVCVWGQWLDGGRRIEGQWGRFGSSAAVQVLALTHEDAVTNMDWSEWAESNNVAVGELFPDDLPTLLPLIPAGERQQASKEEDPWKRRDFHQPMKVAFCVDALSPDRIDRVQGTTPPLVRRLIDLQAASASHWSTRSPGELGAPPQEKLLVTAFCLLALRRFPDVHKERPVFLAYKWVAKHCDETLGPDLAALCGLAMLGACGSAAADPEVKSALNRLDKQLIGWLKENPTPIIERPWFNPYVRNVRVDYMFLSPEIVVSLYLLRKGLLDGKEVRERVKVVLRAVVNNVRSGQNPSEPHGLRVQAGQEGTVDQLWAARLLQGFVDWQRARAAAADAARQTQKVETELAASVTDWGPLTLILISLAAIAGIGVAIGAGASPIVAGILAAPSALFGKLLAVGIDLLLKRRGSK